MNLKELKAMIAEEYSNYLAEQDEPAVAVSDADVDADGGDENAEDTLKDIYDMLKDYFEGDDDAADDATDDAADEEDEETVDEAQIAGPGGGVGQACGPGMLPCPANLTCKNGKCVGRHGGPGKRARKDDKKRPKSSKPTPFNPNEGALQERLKKLANIIKE